MLIFSSLSHSGYIVVTQRKLNSAILCEKVNREWKDILKLTVDHNPKFNHGIGIF